MITYHPLESGNIYHVYNRGNNREDLFRSEDDFSLFMKLYAHHTDPIAVTYAFCLLPNHFHFLIAVREGPHRIEPSQAFSNLCNAYARRSNFQRQRCGALFQRPFGRRMVTSPTDIERLIVYIHRNPERHGLIHDYREWAYSSYHSISSPESSATTPSPLILAFGGEQRLRTAHLRAVEPGLDIQDFV
ncbi:MAG: hypothetical protein ABIQ99_10065 [Thermoflexales bacterium]